LLLGSDYTEGVSGIGIVNAIETIQAFPSMEALVVFRRWAHQQVDIESLSPSQQEYAHKHSNVRKNWRVSEFFPSQEVVQGYMNPCVDESREPFTWGRPDLAGLRKFCVDKLDYTLAKVRIPSALPACSTLSIYGNNH